MGWRKLGGVISEVSVSSGAIARAGLEPARAESVRAHQVRGLVGSFIRHGDVAGRNVRPVMRSGAERMAKGKKSRTFDDLMEQAGEVAKEMADQNDRSAALVAAAYLDEALAHLLR